MSLSPKAMLACLVALGGPAIGAIAPTTQSAAHRTQQHVQDQPEEKRKTLLADATSAINETNSALKLLDENKPKEALAALERATGKLEIILAREPRLTLAPAAVNVVTVEVQGGVETVRSIRKQAEDLMAKGRLQEARPLIASLASETIVSVTNIPLATYPQAIKSAARLIDENKRDEARRVLQTALNTQVVTNSIIPLPVADAEEALKAAEPLAAKRDRSADERVRLTKALNNARAQLELAQALGYGNRDDFPALYQQIREIEQKTADNKSGTGLFTKITDSIAQFWKSLPQG